MRVSAILKHNSLLNVITNKHPPIRTSSSTYKSWCHTHHLCYISLSYQLLWSDVPGIPSCRLPPQTGHSSWLLHPHIHFHNILLFIIIAYTSSLTYTTYLQESEMKIIRKNCSWFSKQQSNWCWAFLEILVDFDNFWPTFWGFPSISGLLASHWLHHRQQCRLGWRCFQRETPTIPNENLDDVKQMFFLLSCQKCMFLQ